MAIEKRWLCNATHDPLPVNIQIPICQRGGSRCLSIRITNYWRLATGALASRREITSLLSSPIKPSFPSLALSFSPSYTHSTFVAGEARWAPSWRSGAPRPVSFAPPLSLHRPRCFYTLVSRQGQVARCFSLFPPRVTRRYSLGRIRIWLIDPFRCNGLLCGSATSPRIARPAYFNRRGKKRALLEGRSITSRFFFGFFFFFLFEGGSSSSPERNMIKGKRRGWEGMRLYLWWNLGGGRFL